MHGNHRGPAYAGVQSVLGRKLKPEERRELDRLIDQFQNGGTP